MLKPRYIFVSSTCYDLFDARAEVEQTLERAALVPSFDDGLDRALPGALDRAQAVAHALDAYRLEPVAS